MPILSTAKFPALPDSVTATIAPLLMRPILGSSEQFVIAIASVNMTGFHIERANRVDRLGCLFGRDQQADLTLVLEAAMEGLELELSERGIDALRDFRPLFASIALGPLREVEGRSLAEIASLWMAQSSSLYQHRSEQIPMTANAQEMIVHSASPRERLPIQVMDYVVQQHPELFLNFEETIRRGTVSRRRARHDAIVDYAGRKLAANFEWFSPEQHAASVDRIKRRLWDLSVVREASKTTRSHEIFVQRPSDDSVRNRALQRMKDAFAGLEDQADKEQIRLRPVTTASQIGDQIVQLELAA